MNRDRDRYACLRCGVRTWVNTRTGRLYSHCTPGTITACPDGGTIVQVGTGAQLPKLELQPTPPKRRGGIITEAPRLRGDESSVSVRAVSAGLPSLGKKRR